MKRFKKLLVPIGLRDLDEGAIRWAARISILAESEEVVFVHAYDVPDVSEETKARYPWLMAPLDEIVGEKMRGLVESCWEGNPGIKMLFEIIPTASDSSAVLGMAVRRDSDLIVVGRGAFESGIAVKLARKAPCSVMAIPSNEAGKLERILVPTDFSDNSRGALDLAVAFAAEGGISTIELVHVFNLGATHRIITLPEAEQLALAKDISGDVSRRFLEETDLRGIEVEMRIVSEKYVPKAVNRMVRELDADLVITSCRGKNAITSWLLGSNAEALLELCPVPIIAAKVKGTGRNLLDLILPGSNAVR
jgi:nucleotide-binding universal stress UspA family protein